MVEPMGVGIQPLKLAFGYMKKARNTGVKVFAGTPVTHWEQRNSVQVLQTPKAIVHAKKVVIATAGYTHHSLHRKLLSDICLY